MRNIIRYMAIAMLPVAASCEHKDLCFEQTHKQDIEVVFDWQNAPDASPESMALYLYDTDKGGEPIRYIFTGRDGGHITVPYGRYEALCKNSDDTDWVQVRNTSDIEAFETYTPDATDYAEMLSGETATASRADDEEERTEATPQMLWSDRQSGFEVKYTDTHKVLTLYPEEAVCHYTVVFEGVENIGNLNGGVVDGTLDGMAEGYLHGSQQPTEHKVKMPFKLIPDENSGTLTAQFLTFGECQADGNDDSIVLSLPLADGEVWTQTFDVTSQVHEATDPHHVKIVIKGLELPQKEINAGGLHPDVEDWEEENIGLEM